jgi:hypothetical protein
MRSNYFAKLLKYIKNVYNIDRNVEKVKNGDVDVYKSLSLARR